MTRSAGAPPEGRTIEVRLRRVYDVAARDAPGRRILVDRLWPRGLSKSEAELDEWLKDAAPSSELRRWYGHDVDRFDEFARRYRAELRRSPGSNALAHLMELARSEPITLLTATSDVGHSAAEVLRAVISKRRRK